MKDIQLWTDGSCLNRGVEQPSVMGLGVLVKDGSKQISAYSGAIGAGTNNRAELCAIISALSLFSSESKQVNRFTVISDSMYAIGHATSLYKINTNTVLVTVLRDLVKTFMNLNFKHVRGHSHTGDNDYVDSLANIGRLFTGTRPAVIEDRAFRDIAAKEALGMSIERAINESFRGTVVI